MEEAGGSSPPSSTYKYVEAALLSTSFVEGFRLWLRSVGSVLAGFIAGEGCFTSTRAGRDRNDGSRRTRFVFVMSVAERDRDLLDAMRTFLGGRGSIRRVDRGNPRWQPIVSYSISSHKGIREVVIPFCDTFLLPGAKRDQFDIWRAGFEAYEDAHPTQWGRGPSTCSEPGCSKPVRGRGLCRSHYYRATGY